MEKVEVPIHNHPLIPFTRFDFSPCGFCGLTNNYIYGGYRCNESGCGIVFHKDCALSLPEINHSSHPDHPLKLIFQGWSRCSLCGKGLFNVGYCCSICDFNLDLGCVKRQIPLLLPENSHLHEHPLKLIPQRHGKLSPLGKCKACDDLVLRQQCHYRCDECEFFIHMKCVDVSSEAYHTCHPQHLLKSLTCQVPHYADKKCLLCATEFDQLSHQLHHCDVCNFSICTKCTNNPPPLSVESMTTHEHQLHLVPRVIEFTCNACGTKGDRSPYFCLPCNFMIHRECIDLPRVININRHIHRISYTPRLGHGGCECRVCHEEVDAFYGAYSCSKCSPSYVVHSRCATSKDVWDMIELEGTPEEEEIPPYVEIDEFTIKHFSHDHNLLINKDEKTLHENIVCEACVFQIYSEPFFSCNQCDFIIHEKCAELPRKRPHLCHNQRFVLCTDSRQKVHLCRLCGEMFSGFRYESDKNMILDVRCSSISDPFTHESHPHPLYYSTDATKRCSQCGKKGNFRCDKCNFSLDYKCATLPQKVMRHRYDDHPLYLCYGERNVDGEYWCEACETKVNPKKWFYTCNDCGVILHISCAMGDFAYIGSGSVVRVRGKVFVAVPNTSISRPVCSVCKSHCKLPTIIKVSNYQEYICSEICFLSK